MNNEISNFWSTAILEFFIALGVVIGGSTIGSLSTLLTGRPPLYTMEDLASRLKIWALVAALGGTFSTIKAIERGVLGGQLSIIIKQIILILFAYWGSHIGYLIILLLAKGEG
ncbi:Sporulation protein YtrH [Anaerobranca californiensis DSM 14826]|jgi:CHASE2 domain-containing sensor protein|uniref:Sporulation protein YtrH n=1 Tax=Anaerobranca californiensis DSM 14826 TaxID=1120989 RepID=A0A1M6MIJ8_9FIRM|nr:YtrH family sporulation protein [Anaerobranca californiensis]SHJ83267.1 Sporulation protein YtrH [Anaerobranca californiensis DSM 14826]